MKAVKKTLFLIDDDEIYLFSTKRLIQMNDLCDNVMQFHNGLEAIEFLTKIKDNLNELPDVILLDINMPVMDGWQFMDSFALLKPSLSKDVAVYMVSSSIDDFDIDRAKSIQEISDFISKPMGSQELVNILGDAVAA